MFYNFLNYLKTGSTSLCEAGFLSAVMLLLFQTCFPIWCLIKLSPSAFFVLQPSFFRKILQTWFDSEPVAYFSKSKPKKLNTPCEVNWEWRLLCFFSGSLYSWRVKNIYSFVSFVVIPLCLHSLPLLKLLYKMPFCCHFCCCCWSSICLRCCLCGTALEQMWHFQWALQTYLGNG